MANLVMWRWGIVCIIAGVLGWVLMACAQALRLPDLPRWHHDYAEDDEDEEEAEE